MKIKILTFIAYFLATVIGSATLLFLVAFSYAVALSKNPLLIFLFLVAWMGIVTGLFIYIRDEKEKEKNKQTGQKQPNKFRALTKRNKTLEECYPPKRDEYWEMLNGTWKPNFTFKAVQDKWNEAQGGDL